MDKSIEERQRVLKKAEREVMEEFKKRLEEALDYVKQGNTSACNEVLEDAKRWMKNIIDGNEKFNGAKQGKDEHFTLPPMGELVATGDKIILKVIQDTEKEKYLDVTYEYSIIKSAYKDENFREETWKDFLSESTFVCSVYDKASFEYIGYCSIKDLRKKDWELAIELKAEFCNQGYGTEALLLFMKTIHNITGKRFFRARVEVDNYPSQKLMKKLGAIPNGVSEFMLHGDAIEKFQIEHKDMITDEMRAVAEDFCMEAEEILGYVLEYRFDMGIDKKIFD